MQSLGETFANNRLLALVLLFAVLIAVAAVCITLYRLLFGRRLSMASGGRTRQPRLGVVDAYDLDRHRQLVLVRRDNTEHLIMIGGPNDVVIETAIVRSASATLAGRDKDNGAPSIGVPPVVAPANPPAAIAPGSGSAGSVPQTVLPLSPPVPASIPVGPTVDVPTPIGSASQGQLTSPGPATPKPVQASREPFPAARPTPVTSPGPRVASPPPARPAPAAAAVTPARPAFTPPRTPAPPPRPLATPTRPGPVPRPPSVQIPTDAPTPESNDRVQPPPLEPELLVREAPPPRADAPVLPPEPAVPTPRARFEPGRREEPPITRPIAPPPPPDRPAPAAARSPAPPPVRSIEALESLEEEMAKLLGRPIPPPDKS